LKYIVPIIALLGLAWVFLFLGDGDQPQKRASQKSSDKTTVTIEGRTVTLTFEPVDFPGSHAGHPAAGHSAAIKLKHSFDLPEDMYLVGYKIAVYLRDGTPARQKYLHHIALDNNDKESVSCQGQSYFFAGAGAEMTEARFPDGYGVRLGKGQKITAVVVFDHKAPPARDVTLSFIMEMAPEGVTIQPMEVYLVGVNVSCHSEFGKLAKKDEKLGEGILIKPGLDVLSTPLKFRMDGCIKFAYPHGHDQLILITLDNKTTGKTLLRTVPDVARDGAFITFQSHQVYKDPIGFPVNTKDDYEVTMVYHNSLDDKREQYGMGNYILYMTPGPCQPDGLASVR